MSSACAIRNLNTLFAPPSTARNNASIPSPRRNVLTAKAVGTNGRENLDHLQRVTKAPPNQPSPKRRVPQSNPIGLWDRFPSARTVQQMMDTMDRIMEDPFAYSYPARTAAEENVGNYKRGRTPWEIKEGEGEYRMRFDMPGMTRKDVKVLVEERMLVVKAKKVPEHAEATTKEGEGEGATKEGEGDGTWWPAESYRQYSMRIALPENVEVEKIKAEVKDGVLYITVPKVAAASKVLDIDVQ